MIINPRVILNTNNGPVESDVYSYMFNERVIFLNEEINDDTAQAVIGQLLFLEKINPNEDITIYINSPGGVVSAGLAIIDTMNYIHCDVSTVCMGQCASMGAVILACGEKGKRYILPNSEVMIHQPSGGAYGQCSDIEIVAKNITRVKQKMAKLIADKTDNEYEKVLADIDRDYWLSGEEAVDYGLVDSVIYER